ncbi:MAG TPA: hypothetical protein DEH22_12615, partial [Chloroflexi bacterium]|nr:hypothetical protein [Chloroflexota bacterium]
EDALRIGTGEIKIDRVELLGQDTSVQDDFGVRDPLKIRIHYTVNETVVNPVFNLTIEILNSYQVTGFRTDVDGHPLGTISQDGYIDINIPNLNLLPNMYTLDAVIFHQDGYTYYDRVNKIAHLKVKGGLLINGSAYIPHAWEFSEA